MIKNLAQYWLKILWNYTVYTVRERVCALVYNFKNVWKSSRNQLIYTSLITFGDWDYRSLIWSETLMELIFNPCGEFRWSPEGPVSQIHSPKLHAGAPGIFSDLLRPVQMLERERERDRERERERETRVRKATESYRTYSIPGKSTALVPDFAVEDLPLGRTSAYVPALAVKDLSLGQNTLMMMNFK